jgi:hypothetical protein
MTEKNQQEKMAAERQVELFTHAFEKAKDNGGVWLETKAVRLPDSTRSICRYHPSMPSFGYARRPAQLQDQPVHPFL